LSEAEFAVAMTLKSFNESWWLWLLCVSGVVVRGFFRHWDVFTWCLLGFFAVTGLWRLFPGDERKSSLKNGMGDSVLAVFEGKSAATWKR